MRPAVDPAWAIPALVLGGWLWGSFLNQLVDRTPHRQLPAESLQGQAPPTFWRPARSICLSCRHPIAWHDNLPILSYLLLSGRCRHCGVAIGARTLVMEILTPLGFGASVWLGSSASPWGAFPWPQLTLSWLLVGGALAWERRRPGAWFWVWGPVGLAGWWFRL